MAEQKTYLELSEEGGASHKFYEVIVNDTTVTVRFGRIGDKGQTKVERFPSPAHAQAEAERKLNDKIKKGYERARMGARQKRAVTRRTITSSPSTAKQAPALWNFDSKAAAFGVFVDHKRAWVGNEAGSVYSLDHDGNVLDQYRLPEGVKCIVADGDWRYAGCDDGNVYDLTGKIPRVAYEIAHEIDVLWMDITGGVLAVSDADGNVAVFDHEDEKQWRSKSKGDWGWMIRADEHGVYHGHEEGVTMYDWKDGSVLWKKPTEGEVLFGWQEKGLLYAGTDENKLHVFTKKGKQQAVLECDDAIFSCAAAPDGRYVFAGDNCSSIYCFDDKGNRLWKLGTGVGSAYSMQFHEDRLYVVTTQGVLSCIDASEAAIQAAMQGTLPQPRELKAPKAVEVANPEKLETARSAGDGVVLECVEEKGQLHVKVASAGFNSRWRVQFPKNLREKGARYVVAEVRESSQGGFYRALGDIRRLAPTA